MCLIVSGKMPTGKRPPRKKPTRKLPPGNMPPGKSPLGKLPLRRKNVPQENCPTGNCSPPQKKKIINFFTKFLLLLKIILRLFLLKLFMATSNPATFIIDLLLAVVNGMNYCHKKLLFRCCGR